jgi:hypothetical protein
MAELKTKKNDASVEAFLNAVPDESKRQDSYVLLEMIRQASGEEPSMWGDSIVGFGKLRYHYASGRSGEWLTIGFSPRKQNMTLYLMSGVEAHQEQLARLGRHTTGKGCVYFKRLSDLDMAVLRELIDSSLEWIKNPPGGVPMIGGY